MCNHIRTAKEAYHRIQWYGNKAVNNSATYVYYICYCPSDLRHIWKMANAINTFLLASSWYGRLQTYKSMHCTSASMLSLPWFYTHGIRVELIPHSNGWKTILMNFKRTIIRPFTLATIFYIKKALLIPHLQYLCIHI